MNQMLFQETVPVPAMDVNQQLPPLQQQLPQWSRVGSLDKARYPKPFLKDRLQPLPPTSGSNSSKSRNSSAESSKTGLSIGDNTKYGTRDNNTDVRLQHLEKSIVFLKQQHCEILSSLHSEIDSLKKENKDLQFQLVMCQKSPSTSAKKSSSRQSSAKEGSAEQKRSSASGRVPTVEKVTSGSKKNVELRAVYLDDEIKQLKLQLKEAQNKNIYLKELLEEEKHKREKIVNTTEFGGAGAASAIEASIDDRDQQMAEDIERMNIMSNPMTVTIPDVGSRRPTSTEYEAMIRYLHGMNEKQNNELMRLKLDLKDILYSDKWTPDAYLLAKAYVADDEDRVYAEKRHLPKIPMKHATRKLPNIAYLNRDNGSLPAMKQTLGNKAAERRKRTQILQKARLKKEIL